MFRVATKEIAWVAGILTLVIIGGESDRIANATARRSTESAIETTRPRIDLTNRLDRTRTIPLALVTPGPSGAQQTSFGRAGRPDTSGRRDTASFLKAPPQRTATAPISTRPAYK
jgi:hypothetical protein